MKKKAALFGSSHKEKLNLNPLYLLVVKKNSLKNRKYMYCMILDNFSIQNDLIRYQLTWYMKCLISNNSVDNCESIVWIFNEKDHTCLWEMLRWRTLGSRFFMFIDLGSPYSIRFNIIMFCSHENCYFLASRVRNGKKGKGHRKDNGRGKCLPFWSIVWFFFFFFLNLLLFFWFFVGEEDLNQSFFKRKLNNITVFLPFGS